MDYESLPVTELKKIAKEMKLKGVSSLRKQDLIARLKQEEAAQKAAKKSKSSAAEKPSASSDSNKKKKKTASDDRKPSKPAAAGKQKTSTKPAKQEAVPKEKTEKNETVRRRTEEKPERKSQEHRTGFRNAGNQQAQTASHQNYHQQSQNNHTANQHQVSRNQPNQTYRSYQNQQNPGQNSKIQPAQQAQNQNYRSQQVPQNLDSGETASGILEVMADGFGFIRSANYMPGDNDVYVGVPMIRHFHLRTGDIIEGTLRVHDPSGREKFRPLYRLDRVNGHPADEAAHRIRFESLTPIFPDERIRLENEYCHEVPMRIIDLISPVGKGQRGMIVSPPKAGKTTLLKSIAKSVSRKYPDMHLIVLLIDERPEEVTDIKESIEGENVEVIYSTFDELPEHHKRVSEMVLERAKRLVEHGGDVMILLDSITRLARAYNLTVQPSGRTLSGGLDPAALYSPKKFFGAARNVRNGGSLTILATALVDTGSKMDDVVFEEFKGTGNMELVLDRSLSERRIFPAIDIRRSGTRRDDLLLTAEEKEAVDLIHRELSGAQPGGLGIEDILKLFSKSRTNEELIGYIRSVLGRTQ